MGSIGIRINNLHLSFVTTSVVGSKLSVIRDELT